MSLSFKELKIVMPALLKSGVAQVLASAPGRGKSEFVLDTHKRMSEASVAAGGKPWGFATAFLATYTPPDLIGYQFKTEREINGKMFCVTDPSMPLWMLDQNGIPLSEYENGILFLDEWGQAEPDVKRAAASLLLDKQVGKWKLNPGWSVICATNRQGDRSGVTKEFDFLINRRNIIEIRDDLEAWTDWATDHGVEPLFTSFANAHPDKVFQDGVPDKQRPWCTPRSLVMAARTYSELVASGMDPLSRDNLPITTTLLAGTIGDGEAAQLITHAKLEREMPSFASIVADPQKVKVPEKPDAQMLVCFHLAHKVDGKSIKPVAEYIDRLPKEFATTFFQAAVKRDATLVMNPAVQKWTINNSALMASIGRRAA
jgi:hypothetical protein